MLRNLRLWVYPSIKCEEREKKNLTVLMIMKMEIEICVAWDKVWLKLNNALDNMQEQSGRMPIFFKVHYKVFLHAKNQLTVNWNRECAIACVFMFNCVLEQHVSVLIFFVFVFGMLMQKTKIYNFLVPSSEKIAILFHSCHSRQIHVYIIYVFLVVFD